MSSDLIGRYVCHRVGSEELDGWEPEFVMNHSSGVSNEDCICCLPGFVHPWFHVLLSCLVGGKFNVVVSKVEALHQISDKNLRKFLAGQFML